MADQPVFSDDRRYWWNGHEWRPVSEYRGAIPAPPSAPPAPPSAPVAAVPVAAPRSGFLPWLVACGVIALLALVGIGVCVAAVGGAVSKSISHSVQSTTDCSPRPCANNDGFIVYVDGMQWNSTSSSQFVNPEQGNQFARVTVRFENAAKSEQHASPAQFVLKDQQGVKHSLTFTNDTWEAVNLSEGAKFGPKTIDFQVPQGTTKGTLVWTPGFTDREIPLS